MEENTLDKISFELILHAGNAKSSAMDALLNAKNKDYETAQKKLDDANEELVKAHDIQTQLLVLKANGQKMDIDILMVHAQDHLNGALITIDLVGEMIDMYKRIEGVNV